MSQMRSAALAAWVSLIALVATHTASAETINLVLSGVDLVYNGGEAMLYDTAGVAGGHRNALEASPVETAVLKAGGANLATLVAPKPSMSIDISLVGLPAALSTLSTEPTPMNVASGEIGIEWFTSDGYYLKLGLDSIDLLLTPGVFFFSTEAIVLDQLLPGGAAFPQTVSISFTATGGDTAIQRGAGSTSLLSASGALTVSGVLPIPEPSSLAVAGLLAAGLGLYCRFR